jgi:hypothetical protein
MNVLDVPGSNFGTISGYYQCFHDFIKSSKSTLGRTREAGHVYIRLNPSDITFHTFHAELENL